MKCIVKCKWKIVNSVKPSKSISSNNEIMPAHTLWDCCRAKKYENPKFKEQEEKLRLAFTEQVKKEENRFRQWEAQVCRVYTPLYGDVNSLHVFFVV